MLRTLIPTAFLILLTACVPPAPTTPLPTPRIARLSSPTAVVTIESPLTATPGLILRGHVRLTTGPELANVSICRSFASYPGVIIATTDTAGYFQSSFAFIPGDEMVGIWAEKAGYSFDPPYYRWRHYYGYEDHTLDFVARPTSATSVPPDVCSQGN